MDNELINERELEQMATEFAKKAMILNEPTFNRLARRYLSIIPSNGSAAYRLKNGETGILINWDHYKKELGEDFTDCIDYEINHEAWELALVREKKSANPFGPDHYVAIQKTLEKAKRDGKLERYMDFKTKQLDQFTKNGDTYAAEELQKYKDMISEL